MNRCPACGYKLREPSPYGLTTKQRALLNYLKKHNAEHGVTPSYDEMRRAVGLKSKSGIHRLVLLLEERGWITRIPAGVRTIALTDAATRNTTAFPRVVDAAE